MQVQGVLILLLLIGISLWISERAGKNGGLAALLSRKLLHVAGVGSLAVSPLFVYDYHMLALIATGFCMLLFAAVRFKWFAADIYNRPSWGIALFPFSFLVLWLILGKQNPALVILPMLVLTFSDAAAAIIGGIWGRKKYNLSGDVKSFAGSISFLVVTIFCLLLLPSVPAFEGLAGWEDPFLMLGFGERVALAFAIAIIGALAEGATSGGWDNVSVPLTVSWLLAVWPGKSFLFIGFLFGAMALLSILAILAFRKGWLDAGGAITAWLLGLVVWTGGGWKPIALLGVFFLTSSILGKLKGQNEHSDAKKGKPRDYMQVICNGGIAGFCMVWAGLSALSEGLPFILFAISVSVSTADTWSSEVGVFCKGRVVDIVRWKQMPPGVSGGISWQGTLAGAAGACLIALVSEWMGWGFGWVIFIAGFAGMMLDSIFGSLIQAKYLVNGEFSDTPVQNETGKATENIHGVGPNEAATGKEPGKILPERGVNWVTNDWVNLASNLITTIATGFFLFILWKGG